MTATPLQQPVYKIVTSTQWADALRDGVFRGAPVDLADGFIHLSAAHQVRETAAKHFAGQRDLLLVAFAPADLGATLRWEVSRGGDLFPHLYAPLDPTTAVSVEPIELGADGVHRFGGSLP